MDFYTTNLGDSIILDKEPTNPRFEALTQLDKNKVNGYCGSGWYRVTHAKFLRDTLSVDLNLNIINGSIDEIWLRKS